MTQILEIDSEVEAAEIGLGLLVHILEIEGLNLVLPGDVAGV